MTAKHTPGPWKLDETGHMIESEFPVNLNGEYEHICDFRPNLKGEYHQANARLIAAAPELLEACLAVYNDPYTTCACAEKLHAAIAKATGG